MLFTLALVQMSASPIISALPDVSSISPANAVGVLRYCAQKQLVSSAVADSIIEPLTIKKEVLASHDYTAGQSGQILTGGKAFALAQSKGFLQSQACDLVLRQAQKLKSAARPKP